MGPMLGGDIIVIEGRGVIPDLDVKLTRSGLLEGKDAQLEAAIQHLAH